MHGITLYLAGGLFNLAERSHNLHLEKHLCALGHKVILPQRKAEKFLGADGALDISAVCEDCRSTCRRRNVLFVGCIDGADADSGTAVEYGVAIEVTGRAIVYRTDIRTAPEKELGINGMFTLKKTEIVLVPCYVTELDHVEEFYRQLALMIHEAVQKILAR